MVFFPVLLFLLISCSGDNDFVEEINTLYEETTKIVYDTIFHTRIDSAGNEIVDTIITPHTESVRNDLNIVVDSMVYQFVVQGPGSMQGADCYKNKLFQFCNGFHWGSCYDMSNGKRLALFKFAGGPEGASYHCNNADFSNYFYSEEDELPLIYVSQSGPKHVSVCRLIRTQKSYDLEIVQTIVLKDLYSPDAVIDKENGYIYGYVYYNDKRLRLYKYKIPDYTISEEVVLTNDELLEILDLGHVTYRQGATIKDGLLYMVEGVPSWGTDIYLRIVNIKNGSYSRISLTKACGFYQEAEDIFFYNGELYCATNYGNGVYKIYLRFN